MRSSRYLIIPSISDDSVVITKAAVLPYVQGYEQLLNLLKINFGNNTTFYVYEQNLNSDLAVQVHQRLSPSVLQGSAYVGTLSTARDILQFSPSSTCPESFKDTIKSARIRMMPENDSDPELLKHYQNKLLQAVCDHVKDGCDKTDMVAANNDRSVYSFNFPEDISQAAFLLFDDGSGMSVWQQLRYLDLTTPHDVVTVYYIAEDGYSISLHTLQLTFNLKSDGVANRQDRQYLDSSLKDSRQSTPDEEIKKSLKSAGCIVRSSSLNFTGDHAVTVSKKILACLTNKWSGCLTAHLLKQEEAEIRDTDALIASEMGSWPVTPPPSPPPSPLALRHSLFESHTKNNLNSSCTELVAALKAKKWNVTHLYKKQPQSVIDMIDYLEKMIKSNNPPAEKEVLTELQNIAKMHSNEKSRRHPSTIAFNAIVVSAENLQDIINDVKELDTNTPRPGQ